MEKETVHEAAREKGIAVQREWGLSGAKRQLGVLAVDKGASSPVYLALPDRWSDDEFQPVSGSVRRIR